MKVKIPIIKKITEEIEVEMEFPYYCKNSRMTREINKIMPLDDKFIVTSSWMMGDTVFLNKQVKAELSDYLNDHFEQCSEKDFEDYLQLCIVSIQK